MNRNAETLERVHTHTGNLKDVKIDNKKGITLVALVITIIILLILAGIAIATINGENGLFAKVKLAKERHIEAEIKEKINLIVSEFAIEKDQGKTLAVFLAEKKDSGEINDFIDNNNGTFDIIINGYTITINENDLSTTEPQVLSDVVVTCIAKEFVENKIEALITVKSQGSGIKQIKLINNVAVQGNNKTVVSFDYKMAANTEYQVEVELTNGTTSTKTIKYEDTEAPTATIEIAKKLIFNSGKIQANLNIKDNRSGVNISSCKWVVVKNNADLGTTDESLYTGGILNSTTQTIETEVIKEPGEYYIHLLLKDNVGNVEEVISEKIEIKEGYEVSTPEELQAMGTDLKGNYYITKDIDMTGFDFVPISGGFKGSLDGQGHTISNLKINNTDSSKYTGIFETTYGNVTFKNLLLKNVDISSSTNRVATLSGSYSGGKIIVEKVGVTGNISGHGYIGSFFGTFLPTGSIFRNCYARVNINNNNCYDAGGFVGERNKVGMSFQNCYWSGTMSAYGRFGTFKANLANNNQDVTEAANIENCFYNKTLFTEKVPDEGSGIGLTTGEFANSSNFTNWDFTNVWHIGTDGYPELSF